MFEDLTPKYLQILADPLTKSILFFGCGGGYDFVHSLLLIPALLKAGKRVVIVSNSFTKVHESYKSYETVYQDPRPKHIEAVAKLLIPGGPKVNGYVPEKLLVDFLEENLPGTNIPIYATCCHEMDISNNTKFIKQVIQKHNVDTVITIDGGTDSIMRGDEEQVATIVEDYMSLAVCENLRKDSELPLRNIMLFVLGFGVDRFHGASDASSMRAVAELTRLGGFLGSSSLSCSAQGTDLYIKYLQFVKNNDAIMAQTIVGSCIAAAICGQYGPYRNGAQYRQSPRNFERSGIPRSAIDFFGLDESGNNSDSINNPRVSKKTMFIWPPMAELYAFSTEVVVERNLVIDAILDPSLNWDEVFEKLMDRRYKVKDEINLIAEDFPTIREMTH